MSYSAFHEEGSGAIYHRDGVDIVTPSAVFHSDGGVDLLSIDAAGNGVSYFWPTLQSAVGRRRFRSRLGRLLGEPLEVGHDSAHLFVRNLALRDRWHLHIAFPHDDEHVVGVVAERHDAERDIALPFRSMAVATDAFVGDPPSFLFGARGGRDEYQQDAKDEGSSQFSALFGRARATSDASGPAPVATTMNCRPERDR